MKVIITDTGAYPGKAGLLDRVYRPGNDVHICCGCFECLKRADHTCIIDDEGKNIGEEIDKCDEIVIVSRSCYGCFSPFVKKVLERGLTSLGPDALVSHQLIDKKKVHLHLYGRKVLRSEKDLMDRTIQACFDPKRFDAIAFWYDDPWKIVRHKT